MNDLSLYEKSNYTRNNFPVSFGEWPRGSNFLAHWHERLELLFFKTEDYVVTGNGIRYVSKKNDLIIINPFEIHSSERLEKETLFYAIGILPHFFDGIDLRNIVFQPLIQNDPIVNECMEELRAAFQKEDIDFGMEKKGIACRLLSHLFQYYKIDPLSESDILLRKNQRQKMGNILEYISLHYNEKLTTAKLAELFHMNEQYFCKFFKSKTGKSPMDYINRYRIERAIMFLETSDHSMTDIAFSVGFEDSNYFTRIFKKYIGKTPREYKNDYKKGM